MPVSDDSPVGVHKTCRREVLRWIMLFGVGGTVAPRPTAASANDDIIQPDNPDDESFIERAILMRERAVALGDQAYGAIVVQAGVIVGESWSRVIIDRDPTGHAEMSAIRDASRRHGSGILTGARLYSTSHPCSMCEAAASWVGISKMIYGHVARDAGRPQSCA